MKIYYENIKDATLSYSGTEDVNFPVENLNDVSLHSLFKDTGFTGSTYITIDFGSARTCNYFIMGNCIFEGVGIDLYGSNDNLGWNLMFSGLVSGSNFLREFDIETYRFWKVAIVNEPGTNTLQIGNIFLGEMLETSFSPEINKTKQSYFGTQVNEGINGYRFGTSYFNEAREVFNYNWNKIDLTELGKWEAFRDTVKMGSGLSADPFYFYDSELKFVRSNGGINTTESAFRAWDLSTTFETEI